MPKERIVDLRMVKDVVGAVAVVVVFAQGNPVDRKAQVVLLSEVRIQAAIVLGSGKFRRVDRVVVREVGHVAQGTARSSTARARSTASRVRGTCPALVLCPQARRQGCTDIDALPRNRPAVHSFRKTGGRARSVGIEGSNYTVTGERKILRGDASR